MSVLSVSTEDQYETSDFPLSELDLQRSTLSVLSAAGYETFLQIIDLERRDFLGMEGLGEEDTDRILKLIEALTVVEGEAGNVDGEGTQTEDSGEGTQTEDSGEGTQTEDSEEVQGNANAVVDEVGEQASASEESDD